MALSKRMSSKPTRKGFPWKTGCFLLMISIGAILAYDTHKKGSFEATATGKFLRDSGVMAFGERSWDSTKSYVTKGLAYIEAASPEHYKAVVDFSAPYVKLLGDLCQIVKNFYGRLYQNIVTYVSVKGPVLVKAIDHYLPGFLESFTEVMHRAVETIKGFSALIAEKMIEQSAKMATWLKTNVFVGKLSPENLRIYAGQAANSTQAFASQTFDWINKKVQSFSKQ